MLLICTFVIANICSDVCSSAATDICSEYGIPLILISIYVWRTVLSKFSKGGKLMFLLDWLHYAKQHLVCSSCFWCIRDTCGTRCSNMCVVTYGLCQQTYVIAVFVQTYYIQDSLSKKIYISWKTVNLDVLVQHVEHDVPTCVLWNI